MELRLMPIAIAIALNGQATEPMRSGVNLQEERVADFQRAIDDRELTAMGEPSFYELSKNEKVESYRFHWSRTFDHPICVRLDVNPDGTGQLTVKITDGKGGYDPGKLIRNKRNKLSKEQVALFRDNIKEKGFWNLSSFEKEEKRFDEKGQEVDTVTVDGADWTVEAVRAGKYHMVSRLSPKDGPVREIGILMMINI